MNEDYLCKYCGKGKIRPIHFSLKQAIIDCDNIDCESFLEKGPWECIITKPLLESSSLCKYERDSVCSDSSSGVHSDLGSSNFSQSSLTDREVESLLQSYPSLKSQPSTFEWYHQHPPPWHSKLKPTNQEPFVALDQIYLTSKEMSIPDQEPETALSTACNEANSIGNEAPNDDFFEMLKEISFEEISAKKISPLKEQSGSEDPFSQEFKPVFDEFQDSSPPSVNLDGMAHGLTESPNGFTFPDLSPSKAIIPSICSAFSEVSPSKINLKSQENARLQNINHSSLCKKSSFDLDEILSSTSSHVTASKSGESISFNENISIPIMKREASSVSPEITSVDNKSFSPYLLTFDQVSPKESPSTSVSPVEAKYIPNLNPHSPVLSSDSGKLAEKNPPILNSEVSEATNISHKPNSVEKEPIEVNDAINTDLDETINILELLADCPSNTSKDDQSSLTQKQEEAHKSPNISPSFHPPIQNSLSLGSNHTESLENISNDSYSIKKVSQFMVSNGECTVDWLKDNSGPSSTKESILELEVSKGITKENLIGPKSHSPEFQDLNKILITQNEFEGTNSKNNNSVNLEVPSNPESQENSGLFNNSSSHCDTKRNTEVNGIFDERNSKDPSTLNALYDKMGHSSTENCITESTKCLSDFYSNTLPPSGSPINDCPLSVGGNSSYNNLNLNSSHSIDVEGNYLCNEVSKIQDELSSKKAASQESPHDDSSSNAIYPSSPTKFELKIESLSDSENQSTTMDISAPPKFSSYSDLPTHCRRKTVFRAGFEVDPWSVPEVYIDELNIEVVVGKSSPPHPAINKKSTPVTTCNTSDGAASLPPVDTTTQLIGITHATTTQVIATTSQVDGTTNATSNCSSSPPFVTNVATISIPSSTSTDLPLESPPKMDIYQPFTLRPEVVTTEYLCDQTVLAGGHPDRREPRRSVGYESHGGSPSPDDASEPCCPENESSKPTHYLRSLLSNLVFDENFCVTPYSEEGESSLENSVSKRLFAEDLSSCEIRPREVSETPDKRRVLGVSIDENSDNDNIPELTIDSDDELAIYIPAKKVQEKVSPTPAEGRESDRRENLQSSRVYDERRKGKRKLAEDEPGRTKKLKSTLRNPHDQRCCGIYDASFPHSNPCFIPNLTIDVSSVETPRSMKTLPCYVSADLFTIFDSHERFGNLKREPEFFRDFSSRNWEEDVSLLDADCLECDSLGIVLWGQDISAHPVEDVSSTKLRKDRGFKVPTKRGRKRFIHKLDEVCDTSQDGTTRPSFARFSKSKSTKNRLLSKSKSLLGQNPSVPEVLQLLKDSGWVVTPCNPVINYKVPPHPVSPTIVPPPLKSEYGDTGSDVVLWALTDKEVPLPNSLSHQPVDTLKMEGPPGAVPSQSPQGTKGGRDFNQFNKGPGPVRRERSSNGSVGHGGRKKPFHLPDLGKKSSHIFPHSNTKVFKPYEPGPGEVLGSSSVSSLAAPTRCQGSLQDLCLSVPLKTLRTKDGATYVRPKLSLVKEEPPWIPPYVKDEPPATPPPPSIEDDGRESDSSDDCIELPDDFDAYEAALRGGFQVQAPPILPKNVFIPPPSPSRPKLRRVKPASTSALPLSPPLPVNSAKNRADDLLSAIISQRSLKEVPEFVCMSIEGKMYVYHRKN